MKAWPAGFFALSSLATLVSTPAPSLSQVPSIRTMILFISVSPQPVPEPRLFDGIGDRAAPRTCSNSTERRPIATCNGLWLRPLTLCRCRLQLVLAFIAIGKFYCRIFLSHAIKQCGAPQLMINRVWIIVAVGDELAFDVLIGGRPNVGRRALSRGVT